MTNITIVIPFYKRLDYLKQVLPELNCQAFDLNIILPVIIADSNSVNNLHSSLDELCYPNINISLIQTINSLSSKRNEGARLATSEYIAFIDDDCLPSSNYLSSLFELVSGSSLKDTIFSGSVSFPIDSVNSSHYIRFRQSLLDLYPRNNSSLCKAENAYAMNFLIKRDILLDLLFSESIKTYGWEDQEFFYRVLNKGYHIVNSDFHVCHLEFSTFTQYIKKMVRYGYSLRQLKFTSPRFFESLSFSPLLNVFSTIPLIILRIPVFMMYQFVSLVTFLLVQIDRSFLWLDLFLVFRVLTRVAFLVGYLRRPSVLPGDRFI